MVEETEEAGNMYYSVRLMNKVKHAACECVAAAVNEVQLKGKTDV